MAGDLKRNLRLPNQDGNGKRYRNRKGRLSESEVMTILYAIISVPIAILRSVIRIVSAAASTKSSPHAVSYNRFVELMPRVFCKMMIFMRLYAFGKCTGITFVESTMIPVCHNVRRYFNKFFFGARQERKRDYGLISWLQTSPTLQ